MEKYLLILFTFALFLMEIILGLNPIAGFLFYNVLIAGCLIALSQKEKINNDGKLMISLLILPVIRVTELFIQFSYSTRVFLVYFILFFLVLVYAIKFKVDFKNWKKALYILPLTLAAGAIIGIAGNSLFSLGKFPEFIFFLPVIAFSEEVLFRGLIQKFIKKEYSLFSSIFFPSLLYGIFSLSFGLGFALFMFIANIFLCIIYYNTENVWITIPINLLMNLIIFV